MKHIHLVVLRCLVALAVIPAALLLNSCASYETPSVATAPVAPPSSLSRSDASGAARSQESYAQSRPGLGTKAGWEAYDRVNRTAFYRRSSSPDAVASFHYNDEAGAKAMADLLGGGTRRTGLFETAGGRLRSGLVRYGDDAFPRLEAKGRQIVMGNPGSAYSIRLENPTKHRLEIIVSVDSLNVLTGSVAGYQQRGYVLDPKQSVNIEGFRLNDEKVKRFQFSSVADSKAAAKGLARNVGVVGLAVFEEDEAKAKMKLRQEQFQREDADAFPVSGR